MRVRKRVRVVALTAVATLGACLAGVPADVGPGSGAVLFVQADLSGTAVATVVVQIDAPDITTPLVFNIPVVGRLAAGTITLPAGSNRTVSMHAFDAGGVETHSGSATVAVYAGPNPQISIVLMPLTGGVPITVTLGSFAVTVTPPLPTLTIGDTATLTATLLDGAGGSVTGQVEWGSLNPAVVAVVSTGLRTGRITAIRPGHTTVFATYGGTAGPAAVVVGGWYVSPSGSSGGDGSGRPWDLQTALSGAGGKVHPGDTIWVRAGTYPGAFLSTLEGTAAKPIVVRAYPGERVVIDGATSSAETLTLDGAWTDVWGLEITNSATARYCSTCLALRPAGVYVRDATNVKLINLIVHDTGHGVFTENGAHDVEIYGCIIYNGGHTNTTRSDGHGVYVENDGVTAKVVRDNVIFNMLGFGIHAYAGDATHALKHIVLDGNAVFDNGTLSGFTSEENILLGSTAAVADADTVSSNMVYYAPTLSGYLTVQLGEGALLNGSLVARDNYIVSGANDALTMGRWQSVSEAYGTEVGTVGMVNLRDNTTVGWLWVGNRYWRDPTATAWAYNGGTYTLAGWKAVTGLGATDQATTGQPAAPQVFIRANQYEPGRATVVIYNWSHQGSVAVDLSGVLRPAAPFTVRNVQDLWGVPVVVGSYAGGSVPFPMAGVTPPVPIGGSPVAPIHTGPDFDVFIVASGQ